MSEMIKFSSQMDQTVLEELREYARANERTLASVLNEAASEYLARERIRPAFQRAADEIMDVHADLLERLAR
jgi:hypothetical protein